MKRKKKRKIQSNNPLNYFIPDAQLDFHDYDLLYPYDIEKILLEFIEDNYVDGNRNLLVITGKGRVVKPIVYRKLKDIKFVKNWRIAGYFNGQDGAFEVELID